MNKQKRFVCYCYPRSGSCWIRYIFYELIGGVLNPNTPGDKPNSHNIFTKIHTLKPNEDKYLSIKSQYTNWICSGLIIIIRNYKECIMRHLLNAEEKNIDYEIQEYIQPIVFFDNFQGNKYLIYYENLIKNPTEEITRFANFIDNTFEKKRFIYTNKFLENIEFHKKQSMKQHPSGYENIQTFGQKKYHYIYTLSKQTVKDWDNKVKTINKDIYNKYLLCYAGHPKEKLFWFKHNINKLRMKYQIFI